jgi:hypothetical protein
VRSGLGGIERWDPPPQAMPEISLPHRVQLPGLQGALQYLVGLLQQSSTLTTLDLNGCQLSDPMVTYLCAVLQHPRCSLQTLR